MIGFGGHGHFYISQSDKGGLVFGGDIDGYNSYAQRGNLPIVDEVMSEGQPGEAMEENQRGKVIEAAPRRPVRPTAITATAPSPRRRLRSSARLSTGSCSASRSSGSHPSTWTCSPLAPTC